LLYELPQTIAKGGEIILKEILFYPVHLSNKDVYGSEDIVKGYSGGEGLQKPEETILNELRNKLPNMKMLDIGVGAGRTTKYFAPLAKLYVGVDYSEKMIKICQQRYRGFPKELSFEVADARALKSFESNYFDLVLFSFNGIDYMSHQDRLTALREISRVTKNGGFFCFSTHNLNIAFKLCTFRLSKNPVKLFMETRRLILMRLLNKKSWKALRKRVGRQKYMIFNDGAHNFRLKTYYVTPTEQIKQLTELEFSSIKIYGLLDGREIKNDSSLMSSMDGWLYYLCNNKQANLESNPLG